MPWLAGAAPGTLDFLIEDASLVRYRRGAVISTPGMAIEYLLVVISGNVQVGSGTARGRRFVQSYAPPGAPFSLIGVIDGLGSIHEKRAHEQCEILRIPKASLMTAMQRDIGFLQSILLLLAQRARGLHGALFDASVLPLATRLARQLLALMVDYGTALIDDGQLLGLRVSQDDLASMIGVTRQRLNVELKRMEREGVVRLAYSRIMVLDEARLRQQAAEPIE